MESCRTCKFASIVKQECRRHPPTAVMVQTRNGPGVMGAFPALSDYGGCGAHEPADDAEIARREAEHPIVASEVVDGERRVIS